MLGSHLGDNFKSGELCLLRRQLDPKADGVCRLWNRSTSSLLFSSARPTPRNVRVAWRKSALCRDASTRCSFLRSVPHDTRALVYGQSRRWDATHGSYRARASKHCHVESLFNPKTAKWEIHSVPSREGRIRPLTPAAVVPFPIAQAFPVRSQVVPLVSYIRYARTVRIRIPFRTPSIAPVFVPRLTLCIATKPG